MLALLLGRIIQWVLDADLEGSQEVRCCCTVIDGLATRQRQNNPERFEVEQMLLVIAQINIIALTVSLISWPTDGI